MGVKMTPIIDLGKAAKMARGSRIALVLAVTATLALAGCGGGDGSSIGGSNDSKDSESAAERRLSPALLTVQDLPQGLKVHTDDDDGDVVSTTNQRCTDVFQSDDIPGEPTAEVERGFMSDDGSYVLTHTVAEFADATALIRVIDDYRQTLAACSSWTQRYADGTTTTISIQDRTPRSEQLNSVRFGGNIQVVTAQGQQVTSFMDGAIHVSGTRGAFVASGTPSPTETLLTPQLIGKVRDKLDELPG